MDRIALLFLLLYARYHSFRAPHVLNSMSGQSPVSRRLLTHQISDTLFRLRIDSLQSIMIGYESCTMRSQMASARMGSPILSRSPRSSNWKQKMVEAFLYLASAISSRSLASVSFSGYGNHSSRISSFGFYTAE